MKDRKETPKQKPGKAYSSYVVYSGIAFQMIAIIGLGAFFGSKLDTYFKSEKPLFTAGLTLMSVLIAIFVVIRQLLSNSNKDSQ